MTKKKQKQEQSSLTAAAENEPAAQPEPAQEPAHDKEGFEVFNLEVVKQTLDEQTQERTIRIEATLGHGALDLKDGSGDWTTICDITLTMKGMLPSKYERLLKALDGSLANMKLGMTPKED